MKERIVKPEILDGASDAEAKGTLHDLAFLNRWFGGYRIMTGLLRRFVRPSDTFTALDAGAATGAMAAHLLRGFPKAAVTSLDRRVGGLRAAPGPAVAADVLELPFPGRSFDFVLCSLLLHQFEDEAVVRLLGDLHARARRALLVIDLERSPVSGRFLPATRWLFRWDPVTLHDGVISVNAGFRPVELRGLAERAALPGVVVRRHYPWFRLSLVSPASV